MNNTDISRLLMLLGVIAIVLANFGALIFEEFRKDIYRTYVLITYLGIVLMVAAWVVMDLGTDVGKDKKTEKFCSSCKVKNQGTMDYPGVGI